MVQAVSIDDPRPHEAQGPLPVTATLPAVLKRGVELYGDLPFLRDSTRTLTFAQAEAESRQIARALVAQGSGKGSRIGIMMPNGIDWVLCWMAIARIGAVTVGFSTLYQRRELTWALRHNDIETVLMSAGFGKADFQQRLEEALPELAGKSADEPLFLDNYPYLRRIYVFGEGRRRWARPGSELGEAAAAGPVSDRLIEAMEAAVSPADDFIIICTSGTTAEPKAVISTHGAAIRNTWSFTPYTLFAEGEAVFSSLPFFWVGGMLRGIMPSLIAGSCQCFPDSLSGDDLVDMLVRDRVSVIFVGGPQFHALRQSAEARGIDLSFVRHGYVPFRDERTLEPIPMDQRVGGSMGMSETFGTHSSEAQDRPAAPGKATNWGRPLPGVERRIVSPETGEVLPAGEAGELQLRGTTLMRGYLKRERHEVMTADGWFPTGDKCMIDEDDFIYFYGRYGEMIKTSGANVAPREVEEVLQSLPEVREAIVLGIPDRRLGEAVAAVIVPADGHEIDGDALRDKVRAELSSYKAPRLIVTMAYEEVPRTDAAGKPRKAQLRETLMAMQQDAN